MNDILCINVYSRWDFNDFGWSCTQSKRSGIPIHFEDLIQPGQKRARQEGEWSLKRKEVPFHRVQDLVHRKGNTFMGNIDYTIRYHKYKHIITYDSYDMLDISYAYCFSRDFIWYVYIISIAPHRNKNRLGSWAVTRRVPKRVGNMLWATCGRSSGQLGRTLLEMIQFFWKNPGKSQRFNGGLMLV